LSFAIDERTALVGALSILTSIGIMVDGTMDGIVRKTRPAGNWGDPWL
jgi:hypothetical protein